MEFSFKGSKPRKSGRRTHSLYRGLTRGIVHAATICVEARVTGTPGAGCRVPNLGTCVRARRPGARQLFGNGRFVVTRDTPLCEGVERGVISHRLDMPTRARYLKRLPISRPTSVVDPIICMRSRNLGFSSASSFLVNDMMVATP